MLTLTNTLTNQTIEVNSYSELIHTILKNASNEWNSKHNFIGAINEELTQQTGINFFLSFPQPVKCESCE